jgi:DnaJ-class molecular chaperone
MNDYEDLFSILNLTTNASLQDIKKAYRILSIKYHPDKNHNANPDLFNKINDAYVKLTNNFNKIKTTYDESQSPSHSQSKQSMIIQNTNNQGLYTTSYNHNPQSPQTNTIANYEDITLTLTINYYDSYNGSSKPITIERKLFTNNVITREMETLYVPISKGIDTNEMIILHNKGHIYINNGSTSYSNIKITIILSKHECFERIGLDIVYIKTISLKEALLGVNFTLIHINNKHYKIVSNEIIDFNYIKIVNNLGFIRDSYIGNLIIKFTIIFPKTISQDKKSILETLL